MNPKMPEPQIAYTAAGPVEYCLLGRSGPFLAGIHGSPGSCFQLLSIMERLGLPDKFRCLTFSRPGYRNTPLESGHTMPEQADLLAALLDELKISCVDAVLAFSAGGIPALEFAERHPGRLKSLVLLSCITGSHAMYGHTWWKCLQSRIVFTGWGYSFVVLMSHALPLRYMIFRMIREMSIASDEAVKKEVSEIMSSPEDQAFLMDILRQNTPFGPSKQGFQNDDAQIRHARTADYAALKLPILILHGCRDGDVKYHHAEQLHQLLPASELISEPDGCHLLMIGKRLDRIRNQISDFLLK